MVWCSAADTHLKLLDSVVNGASVLTGGVFECDLAYRRSVAVLCMLYKIRYVTRRTLFMVLFLCRMCRCWLHAALHIGTFMRLLAAEPRSIAGLLFPFQYLYRTILVTSYSMVWDWRVSRAEPMLFYWPSCSLPFVSSCFHFLFFHSIGLVMLGWGLRTDRVLINRSLPALHYQPFLIIMIIIIEFMLKDMKMNCGM